MVRPITQADTVLAVYRECSGRPWHYPPRIISAAWPDGHVVWSSDRLEGGPPYSWRNLDPRTITTLLRGLHEYGLFASPQLSRSDFPPDSAFTTILVRSQEQQLKMQSCHEVAEAHGAVVTSKAIMGSSYEDTPVEALAHEPAEYLHFRLIWSETRRRLDALVPASGEPIAGELVMEAGELFWQEP